MLLLSAALQSGTESASEQSLVKASSSALERLAALEVQLCRVHPPESIDPGKAASLALAERRAGNRYLLGVYGFTVTVPGVGRESEKRDLPVRIIEGTGELACALYHQRAVAYARRFNRAMLRLPSHER